MFGTVFDQFAVSLAATDMGNTTARYLGLEKAPWTANQSAEKIMILVGRCYHLQLQQVFSDLLQINQASRETHSGKFVDAITGKEYPW